jgi:hypothetical protein
MRTVMIFLGLLGCMLVLLVLSVGGGLVSIPGLLTTLFAAFLFVLACVSDQSGAGQ